MPQVVVLDLTYSLQYSSFVYLPVGDEIDNLRQDGVCSLRHHPDRVRVYKDQMILLVWT